MSLDDQFEMFAWSFGLLFLGLVWVGVIRPFALRVIQASLYRLRDDLRRWFVDLSPKEQERQRFSFLFMERAINSVAVHPGDVNLWAVQYLKRLRIEGKPFTDAFRAEIAKFEHQRADRIKYIDQQHVLIFVCLLFINSPIEFLVVTVYRLFSSIFALAGGHSPLTSMTAEKRVIHGASHQQEPFAACI